MIYLFIVVISFDNLNFSISVNLSLSSDSVDEEDADDDDESIYARQKRGGKFSFVCFHMIISLPPYHFMYMKCLEMQLLKCLI